MKKLQILLLTLVLVACSTAPTTTYDRAMERAEQTQIEQIDANRYIATSSGATLDLAKATILREAYLTCMRQNLVTKVLAQGRITGETAFVYAAQFQCISGLTQDEEEILQKYPK